MDASGGGSQQMSAMKYMPYMMSFMMLFFFNNFASGLSLYYFVSNAITIGIMLVIKNYIIDEDKIHAQIQENKTKPKTMNRFQRKMQEKCFKLTTSSAGIYTLAFVFFIVPMNLLECFRHYAKKKILSRRGGQFLGAQPRDFLVKV